MNFYIVLNVRNNKSCGRLRVPIKTDDKHTEIAIVKHNKLPDELLRKSNPH